MNLNLLENLIVIVMDKDVIFSELLEDYNLLLEDLMIGYPISENAIDKLWRIIHERHYTMFENNDPFIFNLLELYEYK